MDNNEGNRGEVDAYNMKRAAYEARVRKVREISACCERFNENLKRARDDTAYRVEAYRAEYSRYTQELDEYRLAEQAFLSRNED